MRNFEKQVLVSLWNIFNLVMHYGKQHYGMLHKTIIFFGHHHRGLLLLIPESRSVQNSEVQNYTYIVKKEMCGFVATYISVTHA